MEDTELKDHIAKKLQYYREKSNLSQLEVARKIKSGSGHITYIEKGYGIPSLPTLQKLCEVYGITSSDILPF
jgi:transcriptional regulator with XRE-family HTH domain